MAGATKAPGHRPPLGYDDKFVDVVEDDFECSICHLPLKEPVQTRCGHRFCKECLEEHFRSQEDPRQPHNCPVDREGLDRNRDVFSDKAMERRILSLAIKCPSNHCDWTGELRNKEVHLASCLFKQIHCTNEKCGVWMQRRNFNRHVTITCHWRTIECEHCSEPYPNGLMRDHIAQCGKLLVTCPNKCGDSILRELITDHTTEDCPLALLSCPYVEMGCKRKMHRKEVESHLESDMKPHLDLACVKLQETQEKLDTRLFIWKIDNFSEILRQAKTGERCSVSSIPFYTARAESYGYKLGVEVYPNGEGSAESTHLSVYIFVMKGEYDAILPWPFKKKVKYALIDQQEDPVDRKDVADQYIPGNIPKCFARPTEKNNTGYGSPQLISHKKLHSRRYIADDTLFLQVEVGP